MRKIVIVTALATMLFLAVPSGFAKTPAASKSGPGTIVIVFKDGHRQSFSLSDIERVEFPGGADAAGSANALLPTREHFLGKWEVGEGNGNTFFITLEASGD